jgi:K+-transporting ATPase ATPase C chain
MATLLRPALTLLLILSLITGIVYPLAVTGVAQVFFHDAANGSLIERDGKPLGSSLIGQPFDDPKYFWGRPSATTPSADNSLASGGSNLGPTNPALTDAVKRRIATLQAADPANAAAIPVDLVTASGSGLDPQISPAAAKFQIVRVAHVRGRSEAEIAALVAQATEPRWLGVLGEPRVNVLQLNLRLDGRLLNSK